MGREETIVSLYRPHYHYATSANTNRHPFQMVATSLWSPGPLPTHLHHRPYDEARAMHSFHLLLSLTSLGLPQYCHRLLALSTLLTDRLLTACERSPSPRSRRPLLWCAGLLRLMSDKLEAKMCYYNATMPTLWSELLRALPAQDRFLPALLSEVSDLVCSFGSFLKDVQAFYDGVEAELASLEAFLAHRRRMRIARFFIIFSLGVLLVLTALVLTTSSLYHRLH